VVLRGGAVGAQAGLPRFLSLFDARGREEIPQEVEVRDEASLDISHLWNTRLVDLGIENKQIDLPQMDLECLSVSLAIDHRQRRRLTLSFLAVPATMMLFQG
jgi:hypothetical protein